MAPLKEYRRCSECGCLRPVPDLHMVDQEGSCKDKAFCERAKADRSSGFRALPAAPEVKAKLKNGVGSDHGQA